MNRWRELQANFDSEIRQNVTSQQVRGPRITMSSEYVLITYINVYFSQMRHYFPHLKLRNTEVYYYTE